MCPHYHPHRRLLLVIQIMLAVNTCFLVVCRCNTLGLLGGLSTETFASAVEVVALHYRRAKHF